LELLILITSGRARRGFLLSRKYTLSGYNAMDIYVELLVLTSRYENAKV